MNRGRDAVYDVPRWHGMLWREESARLDGDASDAIAAGDDKAAGFADAFVPEVFHRLYADTPREVPETSRGPGAKLRERMHALASEVMELETLRRQTVRDAAWAGIATSMIAREVAGALPDRPAPVPDADRATRRARGLAALAADGAADASDVARAEGEARGEVFRVAEDAAALDETAIRGAVRRAVAAARVRIDAAEAALSAFGWGGGSGAPVTKGDPSAAYALARRVGESAKLSRIVELAGRMQATARVKRATRTDYARSEIVGVEPTDQLARLLPSELGALASPIRTADLVRRLSERAALGYSLRGRAREAKGPIVCCLDRSGSMRRQGKDEWSAAIALAILDIARRERRAFAVVLYAGGVRGSYVATDPHKADAGALLDLFSLDPSGDTDFVPPITFALDTIGRAAEGSKFRRADVVLITDGYAPTDAAEGMRAKLRALGAHVYGIAVGDEGRALAAWTDEYTAIDDVARDDAATDLVFQGL